MSQISLIGNFAVMSSYVLDTRTFIQVDETLYVLVRFKENNVNYVCEKCDLLEYCHNSFDTLAYFDLCRANSGDDRWFFKNLFDIDSDNIRKFAQELKDFAIALESTFEK